jgi:hypothetical protein
MLKNLPRAIIMLAVFGAALLVLGGIIARLGRNAGASLSAVV